MISHRYTREGTKVDIAAIEALAGTASSAFVTAAVTDTFEGVRKRIAGLFGHGKPDSATERRFALTREQLAGSGTSSELANARALQASLWKARIMDLLFDDPEAEAELISIVKEINRRLPAGAADDHSVSAGHDVIVTNYGAGVTAAVIHADMTAPDPPMPGSARG